MDVENQHVTPRLVYLHSRVRYVALSLYATFGGYHLLLAGQIIEQKYVCCITVEMKPSFHGMNANQQQDVMHTYLF